jgi:hypothetical protein
LPERTRRLRKHLIQAMRTIQTAKRPERLATPVRPEPDGMAVEVARAACSLCKGLCCGSGADQAYLDERTIARVRRAKPELDAHGIIRLYAALVPTESYKDSCIFHGPRGCTLSRSMRSDVCNSYFCHGLEDYIHGDDKTTPVLVIAGDGEKMKTSRVPTWVRPT